MTARGHLLEFVVGRTSRSAAGPLAGLSDPSLHGA